MAICQQSSIATYPLLINHPTNQMTNLTDIEWTAQQKTKNEPQLHISTQDRTQQFIVSPERDSVKNKLFFYEVASIRTHTLTHVVCYKKPNDKINLKKSQNKKLFDYRDEVASMQSPSTTERGGVEGVIGEEGSYWNWNENLQHKYHEHNQLHGIESIMRKADLPAGRSSCGWNSCYICCCCCFEWMQHIRPLMVMLTRTHTHTLVSSYFLGGKPLHWVALAVHPQTESTFQKSFILKRIQLELHDCTCYTQLK